MRVSLAQIDSSLGRFSENAEKILLYVNRSAEKHIDIVVFPESALFGYHPFDLLEQKKVVASQLVHIKTIEKKIPAGILVVFGAITVNSKSKGKPYFNSAIVLEKGKKTRVYNKQLLPTGDVFDEARFIETGDTSKNILSFKGKKILITICEDIWAWDTKLNTSKYHFNPLQKIKGKKLDLVINISASPFFSEKEKVRLELVQKCVKHFKCPMVYVNMVGAQDEIIFDGFSFAVDVKGKLIARASRFEEDLCVVDFKKGEGELRPSDSKRLENLRLALILGISDFCKKTGFTKVHLGISGGIDSTLVACLAVEAMGPGNVTLISMPTKFNLGISEELSMKLAKNLNCKIISIPIQDLFQNYTKLFEDSYSIKDFSLVHENIQPRIRANLLMAFSNHSGSLLLNTSNKSELACGYSTLYGDSCGGLSPIGDLIKTDVYALSKHYNAEYEVIPEKIISRPASAELKENQKDQDTLPEYDILDASVVKIVENGEDAKSKTDHWLFSMLLKTEFKRWQAPPILKVTKHSFGRGRRWPVAVKID